ncbi:uracil-DNA glycosylase family protein [Brevundimonas sanguinis]|uniref:uracil-DNA glycosylase family protein n=1 Tax=Brevundimonas sanguinis TaxID=3021811 RepID=UPI002415712A|nr:uracil-DNA glycosylase family protein [Brevundimonas sp. NCCP 15609]
MTTSTDPENGPESGLDEILAEIRACRACLGQLPHTPRPVVMVTPETRLLICGQAPGRRVHESGLPFTDPSGVRLRDWMGVDETTFYGDARLGVAAQAFCFPGTDPKGGDYPPPRRCAELWRPRLLAELPKVELTLLVGGYAQVWALGDRAKANMTETVRAWRDYAPGILPLPHPSWRNTGWLKKNPWFEAEVLPYLRQRTAEILA